VDLYAIDVSFDAIQDADEKLYCQNLPTRFALPADAVDKIRDVAGRLLRAFPLYPARIRALGGEPNSP